MSNQGSDRPRRLLRSKKSFYTVIAILTVLVLLITSGWIDVVTYPWARSLTGAPVLVGHWKGDLVVGEQTRPMMMMLKRPGHRSGGRCSNCALMEGRALVCVPGRDAPDELTVGGDTMNWRGTRFTLVFRTTDKRTPGTYISLEQMHGEWDGADTIRLSGAPYLLVVKPDGSSSWTRSSDDPDPRVTFELRRAADGEELSALRCP